MKPFNIVTASLESGVTLIEASAGTGKTYSITGLILRLVLEQHLPLRQILAVTFTEAATEELRDRVRRRLQEALEDLRRGATRDEIVAAFLKQGDVPAGIRELDLALQSFDEAQIFTIHGFCQRMLADHAFESGARFETALLIDPNPLFQEVARDFWRLRFYRANPLLPVLAMAWQKSPDAWVELLEQTRRHPDLVVIPEVAPRSYDDLLDEIETAFAAAATEWDTNRIAIEHILRAHPGLSHAKGSFRDDDVVELVKQIDSTSGALEQINPAVVAALRKVSVEGIIEHTKRTGAAPGHAFFDLNTKFLGAVELLFGQLVHDFLAYAKEELPKRLAKTNAVTYDDLITGLRDALRGEGGGNLAGTIGERYSAAMIDEFQDTDPAQYEIFQKIFRTANHRLFFIGDPKQAIYGFRGADVFTYFEAAEIATRKFTLTTNWRSEEPLLTAVNALFLQANDPFVLRGIQYYEVNAPSDPKVHLLESRDGDKSLNFRLLGSRNDQGGGTRKSPTEMISWLVGQDIAALHENGATIGERQLRYGDMAVLVRRYYQAHEVQKALRAQGIRSIVQSDQSVFASIEARELQQFLQGVIDPRRDPQLKAALATTLIGFKAEALFAFDQNDRERQAWLDRFANWRNQWVNGCFMAMFRDLVATQNIRARIVALPTGERSLTNFLHLAELLHEAESAGSLTPDALCSWLREQRESERVSQDRFQLRLESDEDAVQIVTIHRAKGLEYPMVFCPFLWTKAELQTYQELLFHDRNSDNRLTLDFRGKSGGEKQHRAWQSEETIAEELRLLYVAITRAQNRCYVYLPEEIAKSPLAQLLNLADDELAADRIHALTAAHPDCIAASEADPESLSKAHRRVPEETEALTLSARRFNGQIPKASITTSFSGLNVTEGELEEIEPASLENVVPPIPSVTDETGLSIFTFNRGRRTGDFFHDVLEEMDFQDLSELSTLIESKLRTYGFAETLHRPAISQILRQLTDIELEPGLSLRHVPRTERLSECEFCYPLARLTPATLAKVIGKRDTLDVNLRTRMGSLRFDPVEGFLRGFIDLLFRFKDRFYLIDWKSNWLGNQPADYGMEGMKRAMLEHNYYLHTTSTRWRRISFWKNACRVMTIERISAASFTSSSAGLTQKIRPVEFFETARRRKP